MVSDRKGVHRWPPAAETVTRRFPPCLTPSTTSRFSPGHVRGMTVQGGRSKDRVVRLEPFFGKTRVTAGGLHVAKRPAGPFAAVKTPLQAAFAGLAADAAAVDSNRTETRLETPDSSMVTP